MPICKLVLEQDVRYCKDGKGKFADDDSYYNMYRYARGESSTTRAIEKTPHNLHGSRCLDFERAPEEMMALAKAYGKDNGTRLRHYVLSLSSKECERLGGDQYGCCLALQDMAEHFLDCFHGAFQCFYVLHEDTGHPHAHIVCSSVNWRTGRKYAGDKQDYFGLQNEMNDYLHKVYGMHMEMAWDA